MEFIMAPLIVGIVILGIYKLFELFARRKERMSIIEKLGDKFDPSMLDFGSLTQARQKNNYSFGTLKVACLLLGVGLGLLVGFFISLNVFGTSSLISNDWANREIGSVIYGASVLLFGGLGLLIAFLVELKNTKKG